MPIAANVSSTTFSAYYGGNPTPLTRHNENVSAADDLHAQIFGFAPPKAGTAYERLAAVMLAELGWEGVKHQAKLRPEGRRAEQRLDVTATNPDGSVRHLLVECKDWNKEVGKGTMDALVGVRDQAGFDAAMAVTTVGFTAGAVAVASDEDIAMVILREFRPDDGPFVMGFELKVGIPDKTYDRFDFDVDRSSLPHHGELKFKLAGPDHLLHLDGSPAETFGEVIDKNGTKLSEGEGVFDCAADLGEGRLISAEDGTQVPVTAIRWRETVRIDGPTIVHQAKGEPCLVVEQLDDCGEPHSGRLIVDRHLNAWDIDKDGAVVPRGSLGQGATK